MKKKYSRNKTTYYVKDNTQKQPEARYLDLLVYSMFTAYPNYDQAQAISLYKMWTMDFDQMGQHDRFICECDYKEYCTHHGCIALKP